MADTPGPSLAASIALKFTDASALAESLATYSGQHGSGGLCIQVLKYYELGDLVQLRLEFGEEPMSMRAVVAWRKPGYIGVRFQPQSAAENRSFTYLRQLLSGARNGTALPPPVAEGTKPFSE